MRVRRLLGHRRLPSKLTSQPAFGKNVDDQVEKIRLLPLPTAFSPRHPNSFRMEHGLYKYTTGAETTSLSIKRSFGAKYAAFKVYSAKALSSAECTSVRSLLSVDDNFSPATSLKAALRHLYHITAKVYTTFDSLAGVFFQVYRNKDTLRPLRLPWVTLSATSRQWNLSCETYRGDPNATISIPRICLSIINFREPFKVLHGPWSKTGCFFSVQLFADLRSSILERDATEQQAYDHASDGTYNASVQTLVDEIVTAMVRATERSTSNDHEELMMKLRNAVSMKLRTSALPSLVKFRDLEITLMDPNRQRYVSNTLLNPDGSERYGDIHGQAAQERPIKLTGGSRISNGSMSDFTKQKIGVDAVKAAVEMPPTASVPLPPINAAELVQEFDMLCRNSDETGLRCCIKATHAIEQRYKDICGRLTFAVNHPSSATPHKLGDAVFYIHPKNDLGEHVIEIANGFEPVKVRISGSTERTIRIIDAKLAFDVSQVSDDALQHLGQVQSTAADEVSVLSLAFGSICDQVSETTEFRTLDEIPSKLAEAVLEILEMPSSGIMLRAVSLGIQPVDDLHTLFRALASRQTGPFSTASASSADVLPSNDALAKGNEIAADSRLTSHETSYRSPLVLPVSSTSISKRTSRRVQTTPVSRTKRSDLALGKYGKYRELESAVAQKWTTSKIVETKTGFEAFRVLFAWPTSTGGAPYEITSERLIQAVQDAFNTCSESGVSILQAVLSKMLQFDPIPQHVKLFLRKTKLSLPIDISRHGRSELNIIISNAESKSNKSPSRNDHVFDLLLPAFHAPVELDGRDLAPDTRAHLMFNLEGQLPHKAHIQETTAVEQMCRVVRSVHSISADLLKHRSFRDFNTLATDLVDAVFESRHEFSAAIDVRSIKLTAFLRDENDNNPPLEKVEVSRAVGFNETDEGGAQAESSETSSLMLDQGGEADIAEGEEFELQPTETTLSILEPRNNEEVTEEQSEASVGSSTTVSAISGPNDEVPATEEQAKSGKQPENRMQTAFVALGSNVGDRLENIENACREMDADSDMRIVRTSPLYETNPMYVADQESFLNGACQIITTLKPFGLLEKLKAIEDRLGRIKTVDKGPRSIDLDILLYGKEKMVTDRLTIPHPLMHEREFVLRPLAELRHARNINIGRGMSVRQALSQLPKTSHQIYSLVPLGPGSEYLRASNPKRNTRTMSVLNVTPDSFSDGGDNQVSNIEKLKETIHAHIVAGATIIDIGGQSSRPNAPDVTAEEEVSRVLPAIEAIKSIPEAAGIAISVDTYRAAVAEAAVKAGAHIINDISAGNLDPDMFATVARLGCTYIMMHMRGTPSTMMSPQNCTYRTSVVQSIHEELKDRLAQAQNAGIRRWRIILDPGIGFSKTPEQNLEVLTHLSDLRNMLPAYPWLVGTSRKSFIGKITGVTEPKDRVWGTAATVTAAVQGGADIVRVHDVREMADVVKMADSMYRV